MSVRGVCTLQDRTSEYVCVFAVFKLKFLHERSLKGSEIPLEHFEFSLFLHTEHV